MPDQTTAVPRPWRRFARLRLRGLIVLVLVTGVWLGSIARRAHVQREITDAGVEHMKELTDLRVLNLPDPRVS